MLLVCGLWVCTCVWCRVAYVAGVDLRWLRGVGDMCGGVLYWFFGLFCLAVFCVG